jgi:hypothetical protein
MTTLLKVVEINIIRPSPKSKVDSLDLEDEVVLQSKGLKVAKLMGTGIAILIAGTTAFFLLRFGKAVFRTLLPMPNNPDH